MNPVASIDYRETELWGRAKAVLVETYRLTAGWPEDGKGLAEDIRSAVRLIVRSVPGAFKKGGITGNVHLQMAQPHFAELEAMMEAAEALSFVAAGHFAPLAELLAPVEAELRELAQASREHARELRQRSRFDPFGDDED